MKPCLSLLVLLSLSKEIHLPLHEDWTQPTEGEIKPVFPSSFRSVRPSGLRSNVLLGNIALPNYIASFLVVFQLLFLYTLFPRYLSDKLLLKFLRISVSKDFVSL